MKKIEIGDIVTLKSGGPAMTVDRERDGGFECCWFDGTKCKRHLFLPSTLVLVPVIEFGPVTDEKLEVVKQLIQKKDRK
jgi:uncharacterized protein YodC (DUF2158 family)